MKNCEVQTLTVPSTLIKYTQTQHIVLENAQTYTSLANEDDEIKKIDVETLTEINKIEQLTQQTMTEISDIKTLTVNLQVNFKKF